ncbi:unnamed protein product, partial [marine sediment metagenome]
GDAPTKALAEVRTEISDLRMAFSEFARSARSDQPSAAREYRVQAKALTTRLRRAVKLAMSAAVGSTDLRDREAALDELLAAYDEAMVAPSVAASLLTMAERQVCLLRQAIGGELSETDGEPDESDG